MGNKPEQKQKWITFKPGIRKSFFTSVIFMAIFMGIMIAGIILFGQPVGMSIGMAAMGLLMTMMNDYTMQPLKNTTMLVLAGKDETITRAAGNIAKLETSYVNTLNVYDILKAGKIILTNDALKGVEEVYA